MSDQTFGEYIKSLRNEKHIGVERAMADVTGMHISNIEKGVRDAFPSS